VMKLDRGGRDSLCTKVKLFDYPLISLVVMFGVPLCIGGREAQTSQLSFRAI
jgi:hypothetical protein